EGLHAIRIEASPDFYPDVARRLLEENGLIDEDATVYAQVSRGAAPRAHGFPPAGTPPTVYAFARRADPPPPPAGGRAVLAADEVFLPSTTLWTYPVVEVDGKPIGGGTPGPIAARLKEILYAEFTRG